MSAETCGWLLCFAPQASEPPMRIFGFAEFIAALALLVLLFMVVDVRYKFRLSISPSNLYRTTFAVIVVIGIESLLSDLWIAEQWWVPKTAVLTRSIWQAIFGSLFLTTFLTWMYYAFLRPPVFSKRNAKRFAQALYGVIVKGSDEELNVIGNELGRSADALVKYSRTLPPRLPPDAAESVVDAKRQKRGQDNVAADYAHDVLLLIANRKLCRHIVATSPVTAMRVFDSMGELSKFNIPIGQFAMAISAEAIENKDSIAYHENDEFASGLLGHIKPWSQAIYGNFELVEALAATFGSPLDIAYGSRSKWDPDQWEIFCASTLTTLRAYLIGDRRNTHSYAIVRALDSMTGAFTDTYKLNAGGDESWQSEAVKRLEVVVEFVKDAISLIDEQENPPRTVMRREGGQHRHDIYDFLAQLIFALVQAASMVKGPSDLSWAIQYGAVWSKFFGSSRRGNAHKIIQFKLRRMLYDEIEGMSKLPNFKGARILGFVLNVTGLQLGSEDRSYGRDYRALAKVVQFWTRRHYLKIHQEYPEVALAVLIGSISLEETKSRLVKTYASMLGKPGSREFLDLDAPTA